MRTYNETSNPYQEKGYLEPKTQGQTYLEWLSQPRRSVEADVARLRQLWHADRRCASSSCSSPKSFGVTATRHCGWRRCPGVRRRYAPRCKASSGRDWRSQLQEVAP